QPPVLSVINNVGNTFCTTPGNGLLEIQASKAPANGSYPGDTTLNNGYTYAWSDGSTGNARNNLLHGKYIVTVTDDETGCETTKTYTVADETLPPAITAISTVPQQDCIAPGGSVEVTGLVAGSTNVPAADMASDYNFHWYDNESDFDASNLASGRIVLGTAGAPGNTGRTGLNPGSYFVVAEHDIT